MWPQSRMHSTICRSCDFYNYRKRWDFMYILKFSIVILYVKFEFSSLSQNSRQDIFSYAFWTQKRLDWFFGFDYWFRTFFSSKKWVYLWRIYKWGFFYNSYPFLFVIFYRFSSHSQKSRSRPEFETVSETKIS